MKLPFQDFGRPHRAHVTGRKLTKWQVGVGGDRPGCGRVGAHSCQQKPLSCQPRPWRCGDGPARAKLATYLPVASRCRPRATPEARHFRTHWARAPPPRVGSRGADGFSLSLALSSPSLSQQAFFYRTLVFSGFTQLDKLCSRASKTFHAKALSFVSLLLSFAYS